MLTDEKKLTPAQKAIAKAIHLVCPQPSSKNCTMTILGIFVEPYDTGQEGSVLDATLVTVRMVVTSPPVVSFTPKQS